MPFQTFKPKRELIKLNEFGRQIAARKAALGLSDPPRNVGNNRAPGKRALLKAIKELSGEW